MRILCQRKQLHCLQTREIGFSSVVLRESRIQGYLRLLSNRGRDRTVEAMAAQQFTGQVAVATGGAQGLGRAIAEITLRNGASVMLFDLDRAQI